MQLPWVNWRSPRTSHATWLKMAGAGVKDTQAQMRHSRSSTTLDIYQQFVPESQQRVIDRLDKMAELVSQLTPIDTNQANPELAKALKVLVARDGVEPPTPAFSGLRSTT